MSSTVRRSTIHTLTAEAHKLTVHDLHVFLSELPDDTARVAVELAAEDRPGVTPTITFTVRSES